MAYTLNFHDTFRSRHIGVSAAEEASMLDRIGVSSLDELIDQTVPDNIRMDRALDLPAALSEAAYLKLIEGIGAKNKLYRSYIGQGYYGTIVPSAINRNIFQNPGWYTQYTPYQAEIAQGRLEALLNFQTMVSDLTGLPVANASLLDEATAAAEAMTMFYGVANKKSKGHEINRFFVSDRVYRHTLDVLETRAKPVGVEIVCGDWRSFEPEEGYFGVLLQYPDSEGAVEDFRAFSALCREKGLFVTVAAGLLSLALLTPPGEWGADAVVGNTQRFGVPMGYGGPHAAYFATTEDYKRQIPGRIIGVSVDARGDRALRMALQTREQHIKREKATSNICTAQALLAIMAGMYAVYHGPAGIRAIASRVHSAAKDLAEALRSAGYVLKHPHFFDTISLDADSGMAGKIRKAAEAREINLYYPAEGGVQISLDETVTAEDMRDLAAVFSEAAGRDISLKNTEGLAIPEGMQRASEFLTHPIFNSHQTETKLMRYIKRLENKDISLVHSMIALGSCTMKLNAASELMPVSWPEFANIHPFVPADQAAGYHQLVSELEQYLCEITGFAACSLQPNSGAQGEYAGLLTIRAFHESRGEGHRTVALIPSSAHGTNPASAVMAGMDVVVVPCDIRGNIEVDKLRELAEKHAGDLSCLMVTYPSTHGVFEKSIVEICDIIHENGGKVYMDGANMNAQVGLTSPGLIKADVCHLNLHKTFAIPHGGGGPGMGPICVNESLAPFLPGHRFVKTGGEQAIPAVSAAPFGSASILLISYAYIRMLGTKGCTAATKYAILNANYIKARLEGAYQVLYTGENGRVAHELIVDLRPFKDAVSAEDVAKRLVDYGFHAPTLSFPVAGTIMIEPTESESKDELDRFCEALLAIREEIQDIVDGRADAEDNLLHNAPHTAGELLKGEWAHPYSRERAAYPLPYLDEFKYWAPVARVNNAYGDRNLICTCPPLEAYQEESV